MLLSFPVYFGLDSFSAPVFKHVFGWLSLVLALPVLLVSAEDYWKSARLSLRQRRLTLDVPIAAGLAAIYLQSAFDIATGRGAGFLDSMCGLVFFLLCGRVFQQKTHERLAFDRDFKSFFPLSVVRKNSAGAEEHAALSQLAVGDRLVLRHGELIPADARLEAGEGMIDYSFVTGESEPVTKNAGDYLYAGGRQMGGAIEIETVKPVSQSYLTSLWNHEAFQKNRGDNFTTLTSRYGRWFTLAVISVAVGAAVFWLASGDPARALKAFTSVLIVACPCALALAAPFTLGTAQRLLARGGVYLKNTEVVERLAQVDAIVFDKTGTLTAASGGVVSFTGVPLSAAEQGWIYSLARHSTHPHSARIAGSFAEKVRPVPTQSFSETAGCGVEGLVAGHAIFLGSPKWIAARGIKTDGAMAADGSSVGVAIDGKFRGAFAVANSLRPQADRLVSGLENRYEISLLSGDNDRERERFRTLFGDGAQLLFNQSPLDKLNFIRRRQESGRTVLMAGDGLNDAGALKQSDVGVAVVEKVGAFSPASDVILEAAQVPRLDKILKLSRRSAQIVRISFGISSAYNLIGVSIAAAGILSPLICAVLMPASSVTVVLFACGATAWSARRGGLISATS
jgi:Cu+-exporting ATPase